MKTVMMTVFGLMVFCFASFGQTNLLAKPKVKPAIPATTMENVILPSGHVTKNATVSHYGDVYSSDISSQLSEVHARTFSRLESEGLLRQPESQGPFSPKIIHVGHVQIYSSVMTAVARKNPLDLLDATFLNISF
jgi:hypothetical protein